MRKLSLSMLTVLAVTRWQGPAHDCLTQVTEEQVDVITYILEKVADGLQNSRERKQLRSTCSSVILTCLAY